MHSCTYGLEHEQQQQQQQQQQPSVCNKVVGNQCTQGLQQAPSMGIRVRAVMTVLTREILRIYI